MAKDDKKTTTRASKSLACPLCGGEVEVYTGDNAHKAGTGYCAKDGRVKLET